MFKFKIALLFVFGFGILQAQDGVKFIYSFEEAMKIAQKENKLIFMDAYTTWCGPCKLLNKRTFPKKEVGDYFNANFVNVKVDMEKGEGPALAKKYGIRLYPTLLFINRFGKVVQQVAGFKNAEALLTLGKKASDPNQQMDVLVNRFEKGDRSPQFLMSYSQSVYEANQGGHEKIAAEFLKTQDNWNSEVNLKYIFKMIETVESPLFEYLTKNQKQFEAHYAAPQIKGKIEQTIYSNIYALGENPDLKKVDAIFTKAYPAMAGQMSARYRMRHYVEYGDMPSFVKTADKYIKKYKVRDWEELNEIAWNVYESVDDRKSLKKAVKWTKCSIKSDKNYANTDTLAALYYKLNKKGKAKKAAKKAIELAKAEGEDYSSTANLLKEIEKL